MRTTAAAMALSALLCAPRDAQSRECEARSTAARVPLLELYTSEGCDSCPSADRWLSALGARGLDRSKLAVLAFHVDYWNYLGWKDRFAQPQFTQRQRTIAERTRSTVIYTPQRVLNGRDYRPDARRDETPQRVAHVNGLPAGADLSLRLSGAWPMLRIELSIRTHAHAGDADAYLALAENGLESQVTRGENRGKKLAHDYVVRNLHGPFSLRGQSLVRLSEQIAVARDVRAEKSAVVAFVENRLSGDVLQSLVLPVCAS